MDKEVPVQAQSAEQMASLTMKASVWRVLSNVFKMCRQRYFVFRHAQPTELNCIDFSRAFYIWFNIHGIAGEGEMGLVYFDFLKTIKDIRGNRMVSYIYKVSQKAEIIIEVAGEDRVERFTAEAEKPQWIPFKLPMYALAEAKTSYQLLRQAFLKFDSTVKIRIARGLTISGEKAGRRISASLKAATVSKDEGRYNPKFIRNFLKEVSPLKPSSATIRLRTSNLYTDNRVLELAIKFDLGEATMLLAPIVSW